VPGHRLRLLEDRLGPGQGYAPSLPARPRVLYVREGALRVATTDSSAAVAADTAWHDAGAGRATAGEGGAVVLRYELLGGADDDGRGGGRLLLDHPIDLDPAEKYLMRADRVDFDAGGVALPHRHRGGGIRCLIAGTLTVTVGDAPPRTVRAGEAWFESGREPVHAAASPDGPAAFIRVSILPAEIQGRTSIMYVDPADAARGRPRRYTVFVDTPIALP
jgi:quercetin dioxygenase-like cupin family protein